MAVVLVTGGARGIGAGIAAAFRGRGDTVVTCGRSIPDDASHFVQCDVRDHEQTAALVAGIVERHGRLDVLVNNAGGSPAVDAATVSPRFSDAIIRLNLLAPLVLSQQANAVMQQQDQGGVIINIGSVSALRPSPGTAAYGAAKAGLLNLTRSLAVEWAPRVRVCAVSPGMVATPDSSQHFTQTEADTVPLGRLATPDDVGAACLWLASDAASYISGTNLVLDGGGEWPAFLRKEKP